MREQNKARVAVTVQTNGGIAQREVAKAALRCWVFTQVQQSDFYVSKSYDLTCAFTRPLWMENGPEGSRARVRKPLTSLERSTLLVIEGAWRLALEGGAHTGSRCILKTELPGISHGPDMKMREKKELG